MRAEPFGVRMAYRKVRSLGGPDAGPAAFRDSLRGLASDPDDRLYAVGDRRVVVFAPDGLVVHAWPLPAPALCVAVHEDGTLYAGGEGWVVVLSSTGAVVDTWRDRERLGLVTGLAVRGEDVIAADVAGKCLRRFDRSGKFRNDIGKPIRGRGFMVPNRHIDVALDAAGRVLAPNPGKLRVETYTLEGELVGFFGGFRGPDPAGFAGCCNPTNIAVARDGRIVVTEKAEPRVKIYAPDGRLLGVFGAGDFDLRCANMDVAVDGRDRIHVIDTERRLILTYEPAAAATRPVSAGVCAVPGSEGDGTAVHAA